MPRPAVDLKPNNEVQPRGHAPEPGSASSVQPVQPSEVQAHEPVTKRGSSSLMRVTRDVAIQASDGDHLYDLFNQMIGLVARDRDILRAVGFSGRQSIRLNQVKDWSATIKKLEELSRKITCLQESGGMTRSQADDLTGQLSHKTRNLYLLTLMQTLAFTESSHDGSFHGASEFPLNQKFWNTSQKQCVRFEIDVCDFLRILHKQGFDDEMLEQGRLVLNIHEKNQAILKNPIRMMPHGPEQFDRLASHARAVEIKSFVTKFSPQSSVVSEHCIICDNLCDERPKLSANPHMIGY